MGYPNISSDYPHNSSVPIYTRGWREALWDIVRETPYHFFFYYENITYMRIFPVDNVHEKITRSCLAENECILM